MLDLKWRTIKIAGHEIAGHEIEGRETQSTPHSVGLRHTLFDYVGRGRGFDIGGVVMCFHGDRRPCHVYSE